MRVRALNERNQVFEQKYLDLLERNRPNQHTVYALYYDGFKYREIARILGVSHSCVRNRMLRARENLRFLSKGLNPFLTKCHES